MMAATHTPLRISVALPTNKLTRYMPEVIERLKCQSFDQASYEIIIVDNNPGDDALREFVMSVQGLPGAAVCYVPEPRIGLHYGRHAGARAARGEIVAYTEDDMLVPPEWLGALVQEFEDPRVGMVGGRVLLQFETSLPKWAATLDLNSYLSMFDRGDKPADIEPPDYIIANCAIRRSLLYSVGGFNPDGMGYPDGDLIWLRGDGESGLVHKVQRAGWIVRYTPKVEAYHQIPASRCTMDYLMTREFTNAITGSFTYFRYNGITPYRVGRFVFGRLRGWLLSLGPGPLRKLRRRREATYLAYVTRMLTSSYLRSHIRRETFLEEQDWPEDFARS
jgi:glycosyltransferase involved in cell wall biosynthesis